MPEYPEIHGTKRNGQEYRLRDEKARQLITDLGAQLRAQHQADIADLTDSIDEISSDTAQMKQVMDTVITRVAQEGDSISFYNQYDELVYGPFTGLGGGGGGGGGSNTVVTDFEMQNEMEWTTITIRKGVSCAITISWSSLLDGLSTGNGSMKVTVGSKTVLQRTVQQGRITVVIDEADMKRGTNNIRISITDAYSLTRYRVFTVICEELSISSSTDFATAKTGSFPVVLTPVGNMAKVIHFKLDGIELPRLETNVNNRQLTHTIPAQSHGAHSLEIWFSAELNGEPVESNHLYNEFISIQSGNNAPIISSDFNQTMVDQYDTVVLRYNVYDPVNLETAVVISVNGTAEAPRTVNRETQEFTYRALTTDPITISISCGIASKTFSLTVTPSEIEIDAVTDQLALYLNASGRSNSENYPAVWEYGSGSGKIAASFSNFNWTMDGWITEDGLTGLRMMGGSAITIPYKPYAQDLRTNGKTIELEFKTHNVMDYSGKVISCMSGDRGFEVYADHAVFKSARSEKTLRFTTDRRMRITMAVMPRNNDVNKDYRIVYFYIDGEVQGVIQYSGNDNFAQADPVNITMGGTALCGVDIYNLRVYDRFLTPEEVLGNYEADRQNAAEMVELHQVNDIFDANGKVAIEKLPASMPYVVFTGNESPQYKGDKKTVSFTLTDLYERNRVIASDAIQIDVQGTSSQYYYVKNYKIKLKNGATVNRTAVIGFAIRDGEISVNEFTLKADVASSESANNILLAKLFNDLSKKLGILTPPQRANSAVRQAIDGFPCVVFWDYGDGPEFVGKYNFGNDKGTFDTFGFTDGDEAWDVRSNTSQLSKFHTATLPGNWYTEDYESIFPEDYSDPTQIQAMTDFIYSTWQENATGAALDSPATYEGVTYTNDTAAYRLAKFKDGFPRIWSVDNAAFYFCYCLTCMMVDSFQKNQHYVYWHDILMWWIIFWDGDTAWGTDNRGGLSFEYWVELFDKINGENVFNGADNVMWVNFSQAFWPEIRTMYQRMRSSGIFSAEYIKSIFHEWQSAWPKAMWNADGDFKYLEPLRKEGTTTYLSMEQGSKEWQRDECVDWRFAYVDSLMDVADALQSIMFRPYYEVTQEEIDNGDMDITVELYKKSYATVIWDSTKVSNRVIDDSLTTTLHNPLRYANDAVCALHNARMIKNIIGLEKLKIGYWDSSYGVNLQHLPLGSEAAGYTNESTKFVSVGTNDKLITVTLSNCVNYGTDEQKVLDVAHCANIQKVRLNGTKALGVDLPNGGVLDLLKLPATTTSIVLRNHPKLVNANLIVEGWSNLEQLWLENMSGLDYRTVLNSIPAGTAVRLIGFTWECTDAAEIDALLVLLDTMRGIDVNAAGQGVEVEKAQVSGTIHTASLSGEDFDRFAAHGYDFLNFTADHTTTILTFKNFDGTTLGTQTIVDGGNGSYNGTPSRASTSKYSYTFAGWSLYAAPDATEPNNNTVSANALLNVRANRTVYAAYSGTIRMYTAYFVRSSDDGGGTLYTQNNVPYGTTPTYSGNTPTTTKGDASEWPFIGWSPALSGITGNTTYYALFQAPKEIKEITDSWDTVFAALDDGSYANKYNVGNYKTIDLGSEGSGNLYFVAKDADECANGSGMAPISCVIGFCLTNAKRWNPRYVQNTDGTGTLGGWDKSEIKEYLLNTIAPLIPSNIRQRIVPVKKYTNIVRASDETIVSDAETNETIYLLSSKELGNSSVGNGPSYNIFFDSISSRQMRKAGSTANYSYWTRSTLTKDYVQIVSSSGNMAPDYPHNAYGVVFGFCLGTYEQLHTKGTIADLKAAVIDGTYSTKYAPGDMFTVEDDGEGSPNAVQILGFNKDELADGSGNMAKIAAAYYYTLPNAKRMNPSKVTNTEGTGALGGWEKTEMRAYLRETLYPNMDSDLKSMIAPVKKYTRIFQASDGTAVNNVESTETVCLLSSREVFGSSGKETMGPIYDDVLNDNVARKRRRRASTSYLPYRLRSAGDSSCFCSVDGQGNQYNYSPANNTSAALVGFDLDIPST